MTKPAKAALVLLATAPIGLAIFTFIFMVQSELAFDEATCPYEQIEVRDVEEGIRVREDGRTCQPGVEEHRWILIREGEQDLEFGQRRLEAELYETYSWTARVQEGRVWLEIHNPDQDVRIFRGPAPDAGAAAP